jgi:hypothetical protein
MRANRARSSCLTFRAGLASARTCHSPCEGGLAVRGQLESRCGRGDGLGGAADARVARVRLPAACEEAAEPQKVEWHRRGRRRRQAPPGREQGASPRGVGALRQRGDKHVPAGPNVHGLPGPLFQGAHGGDTGRVRERLVDFVSPRSSFSSYPSSQRPWGLSPASSYGRGI